MLSRVFRFLIIYLFSYFGFSFIISDDYRDFDSRDFVSTFEGDILGFDEALLDLNENERHNAWIEDVYKWPDGKVYYKLAEEFTCQEKCMIHEAMLELERKTCLNFAPIQPTDGYLDIVKSVEMCSSYVGRQGTIQKLYLSHSCIHDVHGFGNILHELMHAVGFFHEHSRKDRDEFINVIMDNIGDYHHKYFANHGLGHKKHNLTYDYDSLMHYGQKEFSKNDRNTIETKLTHHQTKIGQRSRLSEIDVQKINLRYNCSNKRYGCIDLKEDCKLGDVEEKCKQTDVKMNCPKSCGVCNVSANGNCHFCSKHVDRCRKWANERQCSSISESVRRDYFNNCQLCQTIVPSECSDGAINFCQDAEHRQTVADCTSDQRYEESCCSCIDST